MRRLLSKFLLYWFPVALWCSIIFFLSSIPDLKVEQLGAFDLVLRKIAHVTEYAVLMALMLRAFEHTGSRGILQLSWWPGLLSVAYAASDEIHQGFVPGRCPALMDVCIDSFGVLLGFLFYRMLKNKLGKIP